MNIFSFKTNKNHIREFEIAVAKNLVNQKPGILKNLDLGKLFSIDILEKGISLMHGFKPEESNLLKQRSSASYKVAGIKIYHKKSHEFHELELTYHCDILNFIKTVNPKRFYKNYDFNIYDTEDLKVTEIFLENPDKVNLQKILKNINQAILDKLEIESTFEIELDSKLYYPILNAEDGNCIAVDKKGRVFRLDHSSEIEAKEISENLNDFFLIYEEFNFEVEHFFNN